MNLPILLIEEQQQNLDLMETYLKEEGFLHIERTARGSDGIQLCKARSYSLIIVPAPVPDMNGYSLFYLLRKYSDAVILCLIPKDDPAWKKVIRIEEKVILGSIPFTREEFIKGVRNCLIQLFSHQGGTAQKVYRLDALTVYEADKRIFKNGLSVHLTSKEYQLLLFFLHFPGQIFSKGTLYECVWEESYLGLDNTLMVHLRRLREKIEDDPAHPQYLITIRGLGYKLQTPANARLTDV
ncbi:response regulator transcription factor [Paenibacillus larvae]|nr:response regulator transcription factor [Paenibacillus larvae]PCK72218.1 two-component response regulator YcbM-like protein [Paenibacillus larvae subsp. larvae B-3650]